MPKKRVDTAFSIEQENFIIKQFHCGLRPIEVKHAFQRVFGYNRKVKSARYVSNSNGRSHRTGIQRSNFIKSKGLHQTDMSEG